MNDTKQAALTDITRAVMNLLDSWALETSEMQNLLAMPDSVRARTFHKFRDGQAVFPDDPKVLQRCQYLIRIGDALRTTYPRNPRMGELWMRQPHRRFGRRTPLSVLLADGDRGMIAILSEVDCTFSWDITSSGQIPATGTS